MQMIADHAAIVLLGQLAIVKTNIMNACLTAFKVYKRVKTLLSSMVKKSFAPGVGALYAS